MKKIQYSQLIYITLLCAFLIRILGVWKGYPFSYYPDEAHFVKRSLSFGSGDFNPHWFHKPAFFMYLLFFEYGLYFVIGKVFSLWQSTQEFAISFIKNPGPFYIIGRVTVVLFSLATIYTTYIVGEKHFKKGVGLIAAILLTLTFGHVATSQDIKADTPAMFFTILSVLFLLNYIESKKDKQLWFSVISAGIGTATKLYPYAMLAPILAVIIYTYLKDNIPVKEKVTKISFYGISVVIVFYATFFLCSPYNFLDPLGIDATFGKFIKLAQSIGDIIGIERAARPTDFFTEGISRLDAIPHYFEILLNKNGLGLIIGLISLCGFIYLFFTKTFKNYVFLIFPSIFILISTVVYPGYSEHRHQLPIYPFIVITGACLLLYIKENLKQKHLYYLFYILLSFPLYYILEYGLYNSKTDTRNLAKQWIEENIHQNSKILLDEYGPVLNVNAQQLTQNLEKIKLYTRTSDNGQFTTHYGKYIEYKIHATNGTTGYFIKEIRFPWWSSEETKDNTYTKGKYNKDMANPLKEAGIKGLDHYVNNGYQYAIVSSIRYKPFFNPKTDRYKKFPSFRSFYHDLFKDGKLIKEINNNDRPGPVIKIFRLD